MNIDIINKLIFPEGLVAGLACFVLLWDAFIPSKYRVTSYWLTQLGLLFIIFNIFLNFKYLLNIPGKINLSEESFLLFADQVLLNNQINFFKIIISSIMLIIFVYAKHYIRSRDYFCGEYFVLSLLSMLGMMMVISSINFLNFYLGIELCSLPIYALIAIETKITKLEAVIKYFILSAIFSGILLYGLSFIYGASGSIDFKEISNFILQTQQMNLVCNVGITLVLIGILFKLGVAPLHMWVPDVYHGSPTIVTMLITTLPKITTVIILNRILIEVFPNFINHNWQMLLIVIAILSLIIGNIGALVQTNFKRLLAYSSIGHAGFILLGFAANNSSGSMAANFYIVVYSIMAIGIFGLITMLSASEDFDNIQDFSGFSKKHPWLSGMLLILLLSMVGVPPTIGFYAKVLILKSLVEANLIWVAVVALLLTAVSLFYYLRIIKEMYFIEQDLVNSNYKPAAKISYQLTLVLSINAILVLGLGMFPMLINSVLNYFKV